MVVTDQVRTPGTMSTTQQRTTSAPAWRTTIMNWRFVMLLGAGVLLVASLFLPFWTITLHAPQYPLGLTIDAHAYKLTGDVSEVDGLNHYIGMMKLEEAATFERMISRIAIPVIAVLAVASAFVSGRKRWLLVAPVIIFPIAFFIDLAAWLYHAGHSLDPNAALSNSIKPFTPHIIGTGTIGQFSTEASFTIGYWLALVAVVLVVVATVRRGSTNAPQD